MPEVAEFLLKTFFLHPATHPPFILPCDPERPRGLRTSCPQYVLEGGDLNCTCIVDMPGNPPGYASWDRWRTTLLETGVQRRHDGAVTDVCRLYWLSSVGILPLKEQIAYTLRVACK